MIEGKKLLSVMCGGLRPSDRDVRYKSTILGPEDTSRAFRFVFPGRSAGDTGWQAVSSPDWGVCMVTDRRPGVSKGSCVLTVTFSSPIAEGACRILVIDRADRELEPVSVSGGATSSPRGHLHAETLEVPVAPEEVAGVVIYPRHTARVDWGKVRIPKQIHSRRTKSE